MDEQNVLRYGVADQERAKIDRIFTYHPPLHHQPERYVAIRSQAKELAELLLSCCPPSRELSLAITNLQQAVMWANAAIAINE